MRLDVNVSRVGSIETPTVYWPREADDGWTQGDGVARRVSRFSRGGKLTLELTLFEGAVGLFSATRGARGTSRAAEASILFSLR